MSFKDIYYFRVSQFFLLLGIVLIVVSLLLNPYFFEQIISPDGSLEGTTKKGILLFELMDALGGVLCILFSKYMKTFSPKVREGIINLSLFVIASLCVLFIIEIALRFLSSSAAPLFMISTDPAVFQESSIIPWELKPSASDRFVALDFDTHITINSFGLRDKSRSLEKGNNTFRILILGDSFTYGFGVNNNESYPAVLEGLLNAELTPKHFEVWNAGFASGYSPDTFYVYLREKGMAFNPDLIIVGIFVENDILDLLKNRYVFDENNTLLRIQSDFYHVDNGKLRRGTEGDIPSTFGRGIIYLKNILTKYSKIFSYLHPRISMLFQKEHSSLFDAEYPEYLKKKFQDTQFYLHEIKVLAEKNKTPVVILLLPGKASINELWDVYLNKNPGSDRDKPRKILLSSCANHTLTCFDMWPFFIHATNASKFYFEHDVHWNRQGNQRGAELIKEFLISQKLV